MLTVIFIFQRLVRSFVLMILISSLDGEERSYYQLYALLIVFSVCLPQIFLQRVNVLGLREPKFLTSSYYFCVGASILLSILLLVFSDGLTVLEYMGLTLLPFMAIEVPFFQNTYMSNFFRMLYSLAVLVFCLSITLFFEGGIVEFILIDSVVRLLAVSTVLYYCGKPFFCRQEKLSLSFFLNGFVGISKFRLLDVILAFLPTSAHELIYGRILEIFYGNVSLVSNRIYAAKQQLPFRVLRGSNIILLFILLFSLLVGYISSLLLRLEWPVVVVAGLNLLPILILLTLWWFELSYFSKIRIVSGLYGKSLVFHLCDFFIVLCFIAGLIFADWVQYSVFFVLAYLAIFCARSRQLAGYEKSTCS